MVKYQLTLHGDLLLLLFIKRKRLPVFSPFLRFDQWSFSSFRRRRNDTGEMTQTVLTDLFEDKIFQFTWQWSLRPWQTRTHCCGHIVADTNVSPFARARSIGCGHKSFCVRDAKNVYDFVQKQFVSATNVSQFAQPKKHHVQQCVLNNVSSFTRAFISFL